MSPLKTLAVAAAACLMTLAAQAQDSAAKPAEAFEPQDQQLPLEEAAGTDAPVAETARKPYEVPRLGVHIGSHHWPSTNAKGLKFNNENPGLYVRWKNGITGGFYRNSDFRNSVYGGWTWSGSECGPAVTLGVITGYRKGTIPLVVPSLCVFNHVRLMFVPRFEPKGAAVLHLALEF